jgi:hypothetical protein
MGTVYSRRDISTFVGPGMLHQVQYRIMVKLRDRILLVCKGFNCVIEFLSYCV